MRIIYLFFIVVCFKASFGQVMDWSAISQPVNRTVYSLINYNNQLLATGGFTLAGTTPANRVASWNGFSWSTLGSGIKGGTSAYVGAASIYNNELYVVGNFDSAGTVGCKDIAKWNGSAWSGFGTGSNTYISALAFYNGELYVGGTFTSVSGVSVNYMAKWNGSNWQQVGTSTINGYGVNSLCVYQNELYVAGSFDSIGNIACNHLARWNGTTWNNVSGGLPSGFGSLYVWQNKLLIGATNSTVSPYPEQIWQWDGSALSLFSQQVYGGGDRFMVANNNLYSANVFTAPPGKSTVYIWNAATSLWDSLGTKVQKVYALCEYNNEIYCAGDFKTTDGAQANYIAKLATITDIKSETLNSNNNLNIFPNPTTDKLNIQFTFFEAGDVKLQLLNALGQVIRTVNSLVQDQSIDLSNMTSGIYFLKIQKGKDQKVYKIIKQ